MRAHPILVFGFVEVLGEGEEEGKENKMESKTHCVLKRMRNLS